jgi:hypothetical protein
VFAFEARHREACNISNTKQKVSQFDCSDFIYKRSTTCYRAIEAVSKEASSERAGSKQKRFTTTSYRFINRRSFAAPIESRDKKRTYTESQ